MHEIDDGPAFVSTYGLRRALSRAADFVAVVWFIALLGALVWAVTR